MPTRTPVERLGAVKQELQQFYSEAVLAADYPAQLMALDLLARVRAFLGQRAAAVPADRPGGRS